MCHLPRLCHLVCAADSNGQGVGRGGAATMWRDVARTEVCVWSVDTITTKETQQRHTHGYRKMKREEGGFVSFLARQMPR